MTPKRYALLFAIVSFIVGFALDNRYAYMGYLLFLATTLICWQLERNKK